MSYEEHMQKSRSFYIKGQTFIGLGFVMFIAGFYLLFSDNKLFEYGSYIVIPLGLFVLIKGGMYHKKHIDELAYAGGHTEESWEYAKEEIAENVRAENEEREKLAQAIAKELRK